jgi:hypothetical protein
VLPSLTLDGSIFDDLMRDVAKPIEMISALIDRRALLRHPFHEDLFTEGESIFFRLALHEPFLFVPEPLAVSRQHASNMGKAIVRNRDWVLSPERRRLVDAHEAASLVGFAWQGARLGADRAWVRNCLRRAAAQDLSSLSHPRAAAAAALVLAPAPVSKLLNRLGDHVAPDRLRTIVADYNGLDSGA